MSRPVQSSIESYHPATAKLEPAPIPAGWIIAGKPETTARALTRGYDGFSTVVAWDCTAGMFFWYYHCDEIVHILEGTVHVRDRDIQRSLEPGDTALFRAGTWAVWHVPHRVRKLAVFPPHLSGSVRLVARLRRRIRHLLRVRAPKPPLPPADLTGLLARLPGNISSSGAADHSAHSLSSR